MGETIGDFSAHEAGDEMSVGRLRSELASGEFANGLISKLFFEGVSAEQASTLVSSVLALDGWNANERVYLRRLKERLDGLRLGDDIDLVFRGIRLET